MAKETLSAPTTAFLEELARRRAPSHVFLNNGVRLEGRLVAADASGIILEREGRRQVIWHHAVQTIGERTAQ